MGQDAEPNPITRAIEIVGLKELASECKVTYQAVRKWEAAGRLPRTEWTGETHHAKTIARATGGHVTEGELRPETLGKPPEASDKAA